MTAISVVIVIVIISLIFVFLGNAIFGNKAEKNEKQTTSQSSDEIGASKSNPLLITRDDLSFTGSEFADKYKGKYVAFEGLIAGTSTLRGAPSAHTQLLFGNELETGTLADGAPFWITAKNSTFSKELSQFAANNDSPYETGDYPKVFVTAKVDEFDDSKSVVQLDPIENIDGASPSVKQR